MLDPLSVSSLLVTPLVGETELADATAFMAFVGGSTFLVTNWHVVAGRDPSNGKPLDPTAAVPASLRVEHLTADSKPIRWDAHDYPLYESDGTPRWLEHPAFGRNMDAVALPLDVPERVAHYGYDLETAEPNFALGPTTRVSTIGFPLSLAAGGNLAIWVQGTVASEPEIYLDALPCFLIDSRTRKGQSGSPVVIYHGGGIATRKDGGSAIVEAGTHQLLGVYSGRLHPDSDLGMVWRKDALVEIIRGAVRGAVPSVGPPPDRPF